MRLLHTTSLKLSEFFGAKIPPYAILSHRWGDSEVTFQDLQNGKVFENPSSEKLIGCCKRAKEDGYEFVWIDSCCIDKTSSAELSEAINSMFQWYQNSQLCYAYLSDVYSVPSLQNPEPMESDIRKSKWFTRGWTLQELLAPQQVTFFDHNWFEIGTKDSLQTVISSITGIKHLFHFRRASIAQKMSWASNRETLRSEDMAYCLMGLFGVNMPLLYGEGDAAFIRLQIEIMRISDDESIFAWTQFVPRNVSGLLARSCRAFKHSGNIELLPKSRGAPYSMTNKGLQIEFTLLPIKPSTASMLQLINDWVGSHSNWADEHEFLAPLCCAVEGKLEPLAIKLVRFSLDGEEYSRASSHEFFPLRNARSGSGIRKTIFIRQNEKPLLHRGPTTILLQVTPPGLQPYARIDFYPGLFIDGVFESRETNPTSVPIRDAYVGRMIGDGTGRVLELVYGIAMIYLARSMRTSKSVVLELAVSQGGPPTVDYVEANNEKALQGKIRQRLTEFRPEVRTGSVEGRIGDDWYIKAEVVEKLQAGLTYHLVDVIIEGALVFSIGNALV